MQYLLGIDTGSTMSKAALFDVEGRPIACSGRPVQVLSPRPGWRELNPEQVWQATLEAVRSVLAAAAVRPEDILAVGTSGAGDGGYWLDDEGRPLRPAIQSSDGRAFGLAEELNRSVGDQVRAQGGIGPASWETTVIAHWLKRHEPDVYRRIRHVAITKDYIKYRLTGVWQSDITDSVAAGFVETRGDSYSPELLRLFGVSELLDTLPPFAESWKVAGRVTAAAAQATGLLVGTPVVSGVHDVESCVLGSGAVRSGEVVIIAGTWNINLLVLDAAAAQKYALAFRRSAFPDVGFVSSSGATSAANLDWFIARCCGDERAEARERGIPIYDLINAAVDGLSPAGLDLVYHPFLNTHGMGLPESARAGFYGISGWHTRAHLLRALYEGVVFSHLQAVRSFPDLGIPLGTAHLTGGAAKSAVWSQMFADVLQTPMVVGEAEEVGALGAALCAGVGAGVYTDLKDAAARAVRVARRHTPDASLAPVYLQRYDVYRYLVDAMKEPWERLAALRRVASNS